MTLAAIISPILCVCSGLTARTGYEPGDEGSILQFEFCFLCFLGSLSIKLGFTPRIRIAALLVSAGLRTWNLFAVSPSLNGRMNHSRSLA